MRCLPRIALAAVLCVVLLSWTDGAPTPDEAVVNVHEEKAPAEEVPVAPQPAEGDAAARVKRGGGGCFKCGGGFGGHGGGLGGHGGGFGGHGGGFGGPGGGFGGHGGGLHGGGRGGGGSFSQSSSQASSSSSSGGFGGGGFGGKYGHGK